MSKNKKWLALLLGVILVVALVVVWNATQNGTEQEPVAQQPEESEPEAPQQEEEPQIVDPLAEIDFSTHVEYTWWLMGDGLDWYADYSDNPIVRYFNRRFNQTLRFQHPPRGSEADAFNVMLASGDFPDVMETSFFVGSVNQLYEDGVIIDIAPYLDFMPNLKSVLESDPLFKRSAFNDDGQMLRLPQFGKKDGFNWTGFVYRADIIDAMTGGNPQFPSGNEYPVTIEDWEYMLPLFKQYFEAAGMTRYAPFILPASGVSVALLPGFGSDSGYYLSDGNVRFGPLDDGFYNYLLKMSDWFEAGFIYRDFATRVNDRFFLPDTSLTFGGAAGVWYGLASQFGTAMSNPDHGLEMHVKAMPSPIDSTNGITSAPVSFFNQRHVFHGGAAISSQAENVERLLASLDFFYGEEGSMLRSLGLDAERAAQDPLYKELGLEDGVWSMDTAGNIVYNEVLFGDPKFRASGHALFGLRLPGMDAGILRPFEADPNVLENLARWGTYNAEARERMLPTALFRTEEEQSVFGANQTRIDEYVNTMVLKFILGAEELNPATWESFKDQLVNFGVMDNIEIQQAAYDRFLKR